MSCWWPCCGTSYNLRKYNDVGGGTAPTKVWETTAVDGLPVRTIDLFDADYLYVGHTRLPQGGLDSFVLTDKVLLERYDVTGAGPSIDWEISYANLTAVRSDVTHVVDFCVDTSGNMIVLAGANVGFGKGTGKYLFKYNASGVLQWVQDVAISGTYSGGLAIDSDSSNSVYVSHSSTANGTFAANPAVTKYANLSKWNSSGVYQWSVDGRDIPYTTPFADYRTSDAATVYCSGSSVFWGTRFGTNDMLYIGAVSQSTGAKIWTVGGSSSPQRAGAFFVLSSSLFVIPMSSTILWQARDPSTGTVQNTVSGNSGSNTSSKSALAAYGASAPTLFNMRMNGTGSQTAGTSVYNITAGTPSLVTTLPLGNSIRAWAVSGSQWNLFTGGPLQTA